MILFLILVSKIFKREFGVLLILYLGRTYRFLMVFYTSTLLLILRAEIEEWQSFCWSSTGADPKVIFEGFQGFSLILLRILIPRGMLGCVNTFILYLIMTPRVILGRMFGFLLVLYLILILTV